MKGCQISYIFKLVMFCKNNAENTRVPFWITKKNEIIINRFS